MPKKAFGLLSSFLALALAFHSPRAGTVTVTWQPSLGATGYRVHYGIRADGLSKTVDVGDVRVATLHGLDDCMTWYFAVTAYNGAGESEFSEVLASWPRPSIETLEPAAALQGSVFTLKLGGSNLEPGAALEIDNPSILLGAPQISCNEMTTYVTVEPATEGVRPAEVGRFTLRVTNNSALTTTRVFEVRINPARFDVNRSDEETDGRLDGKDTIWLARLFGSHEGDSTYDPDFDFDGDGWVDGEELSLLGSNFGRCWDGSIWSTFACAPREVPGL